MNRQQLRQVLGLSVVAVWGACAPAGADLAPAPVFGSGMVLQRDAQVPVWGQAAPGDTVTVAFASQTVRTVADAGGAWQVRLAPMPASARPAELRIETAGGEPSVFTNVVVGDVWLCSGQSNMAHMLGNHREAREDDLPLVRQYSPDRSRRKDGTPRGGSWSAAVVGNRESFTATGYFFARRLHRELGVPIGLLKAAVSGTLIEPWTPKAALLGDAGVQRILKAQAQAETNAVAEFVNERGAGALFNGNIAPLIPFAIKGVIWYQGEANAREARTGRVYGRLLPILIRSWRAAWQREDLPFYYVQLPSIADPTRAYALVREGMLQALATTTNTGMAVSIDVNEGLHPPSKHIIGERLALLALRGAYGRDMVASGPLFSGMEVKDGKAVCRFNEVGSGLLCKGDALTNFTVAGADRAFAPAVAVIEGNTVVVSSPAVPVPAAVRYAWSNSVERVTLFNREGLPASPFRSDVW